MSMSAELVDLEMEDEQTASSNQMILGKHLTAMMGLPSNPSQQEVKMQDDKQASGSVSLAAVQNQARPRLARSFQFSADVEKFLSATKECESLGSKRNWLVQSFLIFFCLMFHSVGLLETFIEIPCQAFPVEPPSAEVESDGRGTQAPTTPKNLLERFDMEYPDPTEAPHEDGGEGLGRTLGRGGKALPNWNQASILPPDAFEGSPPKTPKTSSQAQDQFRESQETLVFWWQIRKCLR